LRLAALFLAVLFSFGSEVFAEGLYPGKDAAGVALTPEGVESLRSDPEYKGISPEEVIRGNKLLETGIGDGLPEIKEPEGPEDPTEDPIGVTDALPKGFEDRSKTRRGEVTATRSLFDRYLSDAPPLDISTSLDPFGYGFFSRGQELVPQDLPVASDYIIGPGDKMSVLIWGRMNGQYALTVSREGMVHIPEIGPVQVGGMTFEEMKSALTGRIMSAIGTEASITMGKFRSIQVFVLGEVKNPGAYVVSGMSTLTGALMLSGGPSEIGSLRKVELKRGGEPIATMDLYDLLLKGDNSMDRRLQSGDVIFVPPVGPLVGVAGHVRRPAVYELDRSFDLAGVIDLAGGALPTAYTRRIQVERIEGNRKRVVLDADMEDGSARSFELQDGDLVKVSAITERDANAVFLRGTVKRPGKYELKEDMRLGDIIRDSGDLDGDVHLDYGLIKRHGRAGGKPGLVPFSLRALFSGEYNPALEPRDSVFVFSKWFFRERPRVTIEGEVRCKGLETSVKTLEGKGCQFDLEENSTVRDLVLLTGGLTPEASSGEFELYRTDPETKAIVSIQLDLSKTMASDEEHNLRLRPGDRVVIHSIRESSPRRFVSVRGEVGKPGEYEYASNWSVRDLVFAAGGVLVSAYLDEAEIASGVVEDGRYDIRHRRVDLARALAGDPAHNLPIGPNDSLHVKRIPGWKSEMYVSLRGEVAFPGRYVIRKGEPLSSVIRRAGGFSDNAYLKGAVFTRESVRKLQQKNIDEAINRFEQKILSQSADLAMSALGPEEAQRIHGAKEQKLALLQRLRTAKATGRVSIRLEDMEGFEGSMYDIALEDGDELLVPPRSDQVQVMGAVYNQTAFVHDPDATVSSYIRKSGGATADADRKAIYILKVDGTALSESGGRGLRWDSASGSWLSKGLMSERLDPGDTIVVPEKVDKIAWLKETKDFTQILYQIAVTAGVLMVMF